MHHHKAPAIAALTRIAMPFLTLACSQALVLVDWDLPGGTTTTATVRSTASGTNASAITLSGLNINSASSLWRTRGYTDTTTRSITFSVTAAPGNTLTLESLVFTANAQAGTGAAWTAPTLRLDYSTSSDFSSGVTSAGTLGLGPDLTASTTGTPYTADATTFFATDLVINSGQTYYFRLVGLGANSSTNNQISYNNTADMQLNGSVASSAANLVWAGADGATWNTTTPNFTKDGNPATFAPNDNVTIQTAGAILIEAAGIAAGTLTHTAAGGTTTLDNGNLTVGSLLKSGAGTLAVDAPVTLSTGLGNTNLSGGTLQILDGASLTTTSLLLSGGATLQVAGGGSFTGSGPNTLGSGGGTISNEPTVTLSNIANTISANPLTKSGSGTLNLNGIGTQNSGPVDLDILGGQVIANGTAVSSRQLNVGGPANTATAFTLDGTLNLGGPVLMLHGSTVSGSGSIIANAATSSITSRLNYGVVYVNVPVTLNTDLNVESPNGNNTLHLDGPIDGAGGIVKKGNGIVELGADNTYLGTTTVNEGTLRIGAATAGSLGAGNVTINTGATTTGVLAFNRDDSVTVPNQISGTGNINMSGGPAAQVTLTATNLYTGVTSVTGGTLNAPDLTDGGVPGSIGAASAEQTNLYLNGGTLAHTGATATSCDRAFTLGGLGGGISANGGGPLHLTTTGDIGIPSAAEITADDINAADTYQIVSAGDTDFTLIGAADNNPGTVFVATGPGTGTGTVNFVYTNTRPFRLGGTAPGTSILDISIVDAPAPNAHTALSKNGTNTWQLTAVHTYTGMTNVNAGSLKLGASASIATSSGVSIDAGAVFDTSAKATFTIPATQTITFGLDATGDGSAGRIQAAGLSIGSATVVFDVANPLDDPVYVLADYTLLTGAAFLSVTPPAGYQLDYVHNGGTQIALVQIPLTGYAAWIDDFPGLEEAAQAQGADPEKDGIKNIVEYVLNGNPGVSDRGILPSANTTTSPTHLIFTFTRRVESASDTTQVFQYSSNLQTAGWTDIAITGTPGPEVTLGTPSGGLQLVTIAIPRTQAVSGQLFGRLKVATSP